MELWLGNFVSQPKIMIVDYMSDYNTNEYTKKKYLFTHTHTHTHTHIYIYIYRHTHTYIIFLTSVRSWVLYNSRAVSMCKSCFRG